MSDRVTFCDNVAEFGDLAPGEQVKVTLIGKVSRRTDAQSGAELVELEIHDVKVSAEAESLQDAMERATARSAMPAPSPSH